MSFSAPVHEAAYGVLGWCHLMIIRYHKIYKYAYILQNLDLPIPWVLRNSVVYISRQSTIFPVVHFDLGQKPTFSNFLTLDRLYKLHQFSHKSSSDHADKKVIKSFLLSLNIFVKLIVNDDAKINVFLQCLDILTPNFVCVLVAPR